MRFADDDAEVVGHAADGGRLAEIPPLRADDADEKAEKFILELEGVAVRDEEAPGKPIVQVNLAHTKLTDATLKNLAVLKDLRQTIANRLGAMRTPQVVVLDREHRIRYRGRIDDQGQTRRKVRFRR